jgi:hypothetical protein
MIMPLAAFDLRLEGETVEARTPKCSIVSDCIDLGLVVSLVE